MKKIAALAMMLLLITKGSYSQQSTGDGELDIAGLFPFEYDRPENPDAAQLAIIYYILSNTFENNIHKMRGETENVTYTHDDGREAVYDQEGKLVTNSYNRSSFNYASYDAPIQKFLLDTAPWLLWGNTPDDPTSFVERLYYYTWDLDHGIQSYIFEGAREELKKVDFSTLSKDEKEVYYIFLHVLFADNYGVKLTEENLQRLHDDGDYYWQYFYQVQETFGFVDDDSADSYREQEGRYQTDADIIRIKHFDYYAQLLSEFYALHGYYPFQHEKEEPIYVYILTSFQEQDFKDTNPSKHWSLPDTDFFDELSAGFNRRIEEKYDPQKVSSDGRPNMYIYMVKGDEMYFAIHLYKENAFTRNVAPYYHKMELSHKDDSESMLFSYETLKKDPRYQDLVKQEPVNKAFSDDLDEQYKADSQTP